MSDNASSDVIKQQVSALGGERANVLARHCQVDSDGVVRFRLTLLGLAGDNWIHLLRPLGILVTQNAADILRSSGFVPAIRTKVSVVILPGSLWPEAKRTTTEIRAEADRRKLVAPHPEIVCLTRVFFSNEKIRSIGFSWLLCMHDQIDGVPLNLKSDVLSIIAAKNTEWLSSDCSGTGEFWGDQDGFMFVDPNPAQDLG